MKTDVKKAAAAAKKAAIFASKSRRNTIIKLVKDNVYDTKTLAKVLTYFGYSDVKANKKAVAGTLYDMQQNKNWNVRRCDDDRIFVKI